MFWFIILLLVIGAGFYFYQKIISIEREIRAEQELAAAHNLPVQEEASPSVDVPQMSVFDSGSAPGKAVAHEKAEQTLEEAILAEVIKRAGIKQTDLYPLFAATNKKQLQRLVKEMADSGKLKREKKSSSYLLYPA